MPGLALPANAVRTWEKGPDKVSPCSSPARTLPGTLLPLTGRENRGGESSTSDCSKPLAPTGDISRRARGGFDLKALIPEHLEAQIAQRYAFGEQELGAGGYGRVYLATDREAKGRQVAIKKVIMLDGEMREDFQREVLIMKELDHPNVCKVFESYDQGRAVFLVMEYCEGGELFDRILQQEALAEHQAAGIVQQVAKALKHAHDKGIAHRDLKPENVCFCCKDVKNNHVKVIDWGLGFHFKRARMNTAVGSTAYAAPEVLRVAKGSAYTSACDLWGLGALACVMLCGHPPFFGKKPEEDASPMAGPIWDCASPGARDLVASLLRKDPAERPSIETVLEHPWLRTESTATDTLAAKQILANMRRFSSTSAFLSLCTACVARQLSHCGLGDLYQVFRDMDTNGDGVLELPEVRDGFEKIFGSGSAQLEEIDDMFSRLDIDGSGAIDYTEFCAAGLGDRMSDEVEALWAAFKTFDVLDSDDCITEEEITEVLLEAGSGGVWPRETCERLAREAVASFDCDGNGVLDFDEWVQMMSQCNLSTTLGRR